MKLLNELKTFFKDMIEGIHYRQLGEREEELREEAVYLRRAAKQCDLSADRIHRQLLTMFGNNGGQR